MTNTGSTRLAALRTALRPGIYDRFMVVHYLWFMMVCWLAVTAAITAINVSPEIVRVWTEQAEHGVAYGVARTAAYVLLRILDNGTQAFPITFVLGVIWAEAAHALSGRLTMVRTTGMPFARRARALVFVALFSVPVLFLLDNVVRPFAFMTLSVQGLGDYGWSYAKNRQPSPEWLAIDGAAIQGVLEPRPVPRFTQVTLYVFSPGGAVERIVHAQALEPASGDRHSWQIRDADIWDFPAANAENPVAPATNTHTRVDLAPAGVRISHLWLKYRGIQPKYVPLPDLVSLATDTALPDDHPKYSEWLGIRIFQCLAPGLIAICLGAVFALLLDMAGLVAATVTALFAGYLAYFLVRLSAVLAENHVLAPATASLAMPVILSVSFVLLLRIIAARDRLT